MAIIKTKGNRTEIINEVPLELKKKVGYLLNILITDYGIESKFDNCSDKNIMLNGFKKRLKSNLYVLIDNEYHTEK